jgi:flagellin
MLSVNTNAGALVALENLNNTSQSLETAQNIVSTGLAVANAKDNGAIWAIAQNERATISSLDAVKSSLQTGQSIIDQSLDTASRASLNSDFVALRNQITSTVQNAEFNGVNLLNGSLTDITSLANAQGTSVLTTVAQNLTLGGSIITLTATATISTSAAAATVLTTVEASLAAVDNALAQMGTSSKALDTHLNFVSNLQDTLTTGVGNLVNADLAKESATLQALQTKQQLGIQALSIANSASSALLGLFR